MKVHARLFASLAMLMLLPGCATHYLWNDSLLAEPHAPALQNHLQLYQIPDKHDLLAVYDEINPRGLSQRRAYLVFQNEMFIAASRKPLFLRPSLIPVGIPVPTFERSGFNAATNLPLFALKTGSYAFELHQGDFEPRSYDLPRYRDRWNTSKQAMITPAAVALDSTIIAGAVAAGAAYLWARSYAGTTSYIPEKPK